MTRLPRDVAVEVVVAATAPDLWAVLTDVSRIGEWSHEATSARWVSGTGPSVGNVFRGANRSGPLRWSRPCTVLESVAPSRFGYRTDGGLLGDRTRWTFTLSPVGEGTRIRLTYAIERMPRWFVTVVVRVLPHHLDRTAALRGDLERLGALAGRDATRGV